MIKPVRDTSLDLLLELDGQVLVVDEKAGYWVKFAVCRVPASKERPHGLAYSLTLHDAAGERLIGFDNAHPVRGGKASGRDHRHRLKTVRPYTYKDAAGLLEDFWTEVDKVLRERGALS